MKLGSGEWYWYCKYCDQELDRGYDATACEDAAECPCSQEWGGDACGYIVCEYCHRPASERRRSR